MNAELDELDPRFSDPQAVPTKWAAARDQLEAARTYLLTTVRPDGRPHATTIADPDRLARMADAFTAKYDDFFGLRLRDGSLQSEGAPDEILAFEVRATKAFGFAKGDSFGQTRWRFTTP